MLSENKTDLQLSEELMCRGWWDEAEKVLSRPGIAPSNRVLQNAALACRRECVEWIQGQSGEEITARDLLRLFDRYTVYWVLNNYRGKDAGEWQLKREKVSVLMD